MNHHPRNPAPRHGRREAHSSVSARTSLDTYELLPQPIPPEVMPQWAATLEIVFVVPPRHRRHHPVQVRPLYLGAGRTRVRLIAPYAPSKCAPHRGGCLAMHPPITWQCFPLSTGCGVAGADTGARMGAEGVGDSGRLHGK